MLKCDLTAGWDLTGGTGGRVLVTGLRDPPTGVSCGARCRWTLPCHFPLGCDVIACFVIERPTIALISSCAPTQFKNVRKGVKHNLSHELDIYIEAPV